jgi:hypothetical protein
MLWRQGDIYIESAESVPPTAIRLPHAVLAEGEVTGHQHRIEDPRSAIVYEERFDMFVEVLADSARLVHDEHGPILLPRGVYRVWRQREYDPSLIGTFWTDGEAAPDSGRWVKD